MRPAPIIILSLVLLSSIFVSVSESAIARGIRHAGFGAVLALVPEESRIADELRSMINRTRLDATDADKAQEDSARLAHLKESHPEALENFSAVLGERGQNVQWVPARPLEEQARADIPRTLILDRGQQQGIGIQALAFSPDGFAGIVALAEDQRCVVLLLTDQQCQIAAQVPGAGETGMLCGLAPQSNEEEPLLLLKYLSRYANPEPGTEVRSSGIGGLYPANLLLGTVVSYKAGDLHGEALVRPVVKFAELETLLLTRTSLP